MKQRGFIFFIFILFTFFVMSVSMLVVEFVEHETQANRSMQVA